MNDKKFKVVMTSGAVHITGFDNSMREVFSDFARKRIRWTTEFRRGRFVRKPDKVFGASNYYRTEYRFHRHDWEQLKEHLAVYGITEDQYSFTKRKFYTPKVIKVASPDEWKPRDYQEDIIQAAIRKSIYSLVIPLQTGYGKFSRNGTPILTPHGWKKIEELEVGDAIMGSSGDKQHVSGTYPQGKQLMYRVTFKDGRYTDCGLPHLWTHWDKEKSVWMTSTTEQLIGRFRDDQTYSTFVPPYLGEEVTRELNTTIVSVIPLNESDDATCIRVSNPDRLYVCDDYIVTHNTAVALFTVEELQQRTAVVSKLKHVKQWKRDIKEQFRCDDKDIMLISGAPALIKAIKLAKEDKLEAKFLLFSNSTLQVFIKNYELGDWTKYGCKPDKLMERLGVGLRVVDEAHENLHLNFKLDLYLHQPKTLHLSASLESDDEFINRMSEILYPLKLRHDKLEWDKYIDVYAMAYRHTRSDMQYQFSGNPSYNHMALDQWYLSKPKVLENYFKFIGDLLYKNYVDGYKEGLKAVVFVAYVDMATALTKYLSERFGKYWVARYCGSEDDPQENLYDADIRVTTPESCGTGTDIPNLSFNLCMVNISSRQRNIQVQGRTRKIKLYPDMTPVFMYCYAMDIDKHMKAHEKRLEIFESKAKSIRTIISSYRV